MFLLVGGDALAVSAVQHFADQPRADTAGLPHRIDADGEQVEVVWLVGMLAVHELTAAVQAFAALVGAGDVGPAVLQFWGWGGSPKPGGRQTATARALVRDVRLAVAEDPAGIRMVGPVAGALVLLGFLAFRRYSLTGDVPQLGAPAA